MYVCDRCTAGNIPDYVTAKLDKLRQVYLRVGLFWLYCPEQPIKSEWGETFGADVIFRSVKYEIAPYLLPFVTMCGVNVGIQSTYGHFARFGIIET